MVSHERNVNDRRLKMTYREEIESFDILTLDDIIAAAKKHVPAQYTRQPWTFPELNHGVAVLKTTDAMNCYMASYGQAHKEKIDEAVKAFPWKELNSEIEIIDWGCGQGLASVHFINYLNKNNLISKLQKVTLIEPGKPALERAVLHVSRSIGQHTKIQPIQKYLPSVFDNSDCIDDLHIEEPICIHLFSNILDIPQINLKKLSELVGNTGYRHYFICMGPMNAGNRRMDGFSRYFSINDHDWFSRKDISMFGTYPNGVSYTCVTRAFKIVRDEGKPFLIPIAYFPPKTFEASYKLDAVWNKDQTPSENSHSSFDVLAPFDIGASVYTDVDPVMAVLNNIVTRGIATKCSPFIERAFSEIIGATEETEKYGSISYKLINQTLFSKYENYFRFIPVGVAWIQKMVIEAILTGQLDLEQESWDVVVKEDGIPCSALAFADLIQMFNHLCSLSVKDSERRFPKVNLSIISPSNKDSKFHLGNHTYSAPKQLDREKEYDLVIDISFKEKADPEHVQFSEFKARYDCYFILRPSDYSSTRQIYTSGRINYKPVAKLTSAGTNEAIDKSVEHLNYFLTLLFRKRAFRPGQLPILNRALQNKSVIGLLPTGGGKSLTYQLAAMLQPGVTIIIDPLKSLMQDQYDGLRSIGIDVCTYINSELDYPERAAHEEMVENSQVIFAFMSPERLCIYEFRKRLRNMHQLGVYFSYGVIDEVHCVSEWGQDFRFSYLHLGRNLYSYVKAKEGEISLFGLTATASFDVLSDVERELSGHGAFTLDPETIVRYENSNRLELQYKIERVEVPCDPDKFDDHGLLHNYPMPVKLPNSWGMSRSKSDYLRELLPKIPGYLRELQEEDSEERIISRFKEREELSSNVAGQDLHVDVDDDFMTKHESYDSAGIVFCPHVKSTEMSVQVNADNLSNICELGTFAGSDQGLGMDNNSMENMRLFRDNRLPLMVATKAFGMGIDKPNVRFTVNMNYSSSLESFVQEAGRAGRDRKMALSIILMSQYRLARINRRCPIWSDPIPVIKGKWFKECDLKTILNGFGLSIDPQFIDICDPVSDMVRLKCPTAKNMADEQDNKTLNWNWPCNDTCSKYENCQLRHTDNAHRFKWLYYKDLKSYLDANGIRFGAENIEYQCGDYSTVMYFFDNNFKGELEEKKKMHELLSVKPITYFFGNDVQYKDDQLHEGKGFMEALINSNIGDELVVWIPYDDDSYQDVAKAIYRMCIIGLIDDFTQDYNRHKFRIVTERKKTGAYYERMKQFLMRYYSEERAENEVERASVRKGQNEIHKCLGYLTEFVYDKVVMKRKRAIDDIRNFCLTGIREDKDWKEINEDLKDEIFYYFNSKFARQGYETEAGEPFSLYDDVVDNKLRGFDTIFKFMRVIDNDVIGASGSPKDNIKHLRGAVRLIRRGETDVNPALSLLNVFCILVLWRPEDNNMLNDMENSFIEGYTQLLGETMDKELFYRSILRFYKELNANGRNIASIGMLDRLKGLANVAELSVNLKWLDNFKQQYAI